MAVYHLADISFKQVGMLDREKKIVLFPIGSM